MAQAKKRAPNAKNAMDAISILTEDHDRVKTMFTDFDKLTKSEDKEQEKSALVERICEELTIHARIEEEIFYPAVRAAIDDDDLMDEADVEHAGAKELIAQLEEMEPGDDHFDAKVTVLGENVDHHVKEEQGEIFPKAKKAKLDFVALGAQLLERKKELQAIRGTSVGKAR
jgi:hemerythrin-like domain-containing protein